MTVEVQPTAPIKSVIYHCDRTFFTSPLKELMQDEDSESYGVIVIDWKSALFGILQGSTRRVLRELSVELPNKQGRGGQSQNRFQRLRVEKIQIYVRKVAEEATRFFIDGKACLPNIKGLILAGSANLKDDLLKHKAFDKRLIKIVLRFQDIAYGGRSGFAEAIEGSLEVIGNHSLLREKRILKRFFEEVGRDTGLCCFSAEDTLQALEIGAVEVLVICEDNETIRYGYEDDSVELLDSKIKPAPREVELTSSGRLVDWILNNYQSFGCEVVLISDQSTLGMQFLRGFGWLGGLLRWAINFEELNGHNQRALQRECKDEDESSSSSGPQDREVEDDADFGF